MASAVLKEAESENGRKQSGEEAAAEQGEVAGTLTEAEWGAEARTLTEAEREAAAGTLTEAERGAAAGTLTEAQRERARRQRERAAALRRARVPAPAPALSAGGFLVEAAPRDPPPLRRDPAPLPHPSEQPSCLRCEESFPQSFLFDNFDYSVCDACREADEEYELVTRTEAKAEFLLQDCDLDSREPPLRCVRRRNPHRVGGDMRLYVRAQVRSRALLVWGSEEALLAERARRAERAARAADTKRRKRLAELRRAVRPPALGRPPHRHRWAAEQYDAAADTYSRRCLDCDHVETYEKM